MPEVALSFRQVLFGGAAIPFGGLLVILGDAVAVGVEPTETVLSQGIAFFGGFAVPFCGLVVVFRDAKTFGVEDAKIVLGQCVSLFGRSSKSFSRRGVIGVRAAFQVTFSFGILGFGIALFSRIAGRLLVWI